MADPNISLMGATYSGVKGVTLPKSGGGTATFPWVEGSETKTQNGTYDVTNLAQLIVNVSGGGGTGLEYESGTYTTSTNIAKPTISFSKTHTTTPIFIMMVDVTGTYSDTTNSNYEFVYVDWYRMWGYGYYDSTSQVSYGAAFYRYRASNASSFSRNQTYFIYNSDNTGTSNSSYPRYWANESAFNPYSNSTSRYWRSGRTYKWIAVWKP